MIAQRTTQSFQTSDGTLLHVDDSGGTGLPFLFQHGLCGDAKQAAEVSPPTANVRRMTLEMRGHGQSRPGPVACFSISTFADDCGDFLTERGIHSIVAGGISMGAAIASRLAVIRPSIVRALILARPAWVASAEPPNMWPNAEVGRLLETLPPKKAEAQFMSSSAAERLAVEAPDNLASLRGFFSRKDGATTGALLTRISADGPGISRSQLAALSMPTLVIGTREDTIHPFAMAEDLASLIPAARLVEITPKAQDRARYVAEFQSAIHSFLKGL